MEVNTNLFDTQMKGQQLMFGVSIVLLFCSLCSTFVLHALKPNSVRVHGVASEPFLGQTQSQYVATGHPSNHAIPMISMFDKDQDSGCTRCRTIRIGVPGINNPNHAWYKREGMIFTVYINKPKDVNDAEVKPYKSFPVNQYFGRWECSFTFEDGFWQEQDWVVNDGILELVLIDVKNKPIFPRKQPTSQAVEFSFISASDDKQSANFNNDNDSASLLAPVPDSLDITEGSSTHSWDCVVQKVEHSQVESSHQPLSVPSPQPSILTSFSGTDGSKTYSEKCFSEGTLFKTDGGYVAVEDLLLGQKLQSAENKQVLVVKRELYKSLDVFTLRSESGVILKVTGTHRMMVRRGGKPETFQVKKLKRGDEVICRSGNQTIAEITPDTTPQTVYQVTFEPDVSIEAFYRPPDACLSKAYKPKQSRRGGQASKNIPDDRTDHGFGD